MHTFHCSSGWIIHFLKRLIPLQCNGRTAGYRWLRWYTTGGFIAREVLRKYGTVEVFFLRSWRIHREAKSCVGELLVGHCFGSDLFQGVDPAITNAIRELFFLSPRHLFRQVIFESFSQHSFFHFAIAAHFVCRIHPHSHIHEFFIQERHTAFHAPCRQRFVGPQAVV